MTTSEELFGQHIPNTQLTTAQKNACQRLNYKKRGGMTDRLREQHRIYSAKYRTTEEGQTKIKAYRDKKETKERLKELRRTDKYIETKKKAQARYQQTPKYKLTAALNRAKRRSSKTGSKLYLAHKDTPCIACGNEENLHLDHIIPICAGGKTRLANLWVLCSTCNKRKQAKPWVSFIKELKGAV